MNRIVLHVDMNAFFASVEQRDRPALAGKPVAVVGGAGRRGLVLTASYEARPFGVKTGLRLFEARALCPTLIAVPGRHGVYSAASKALWPFFTALTERVEMCSVDEAYLDITDPRRGADWEWARGEARRLQQRIDRELRLPCSVGVAPNKLLAKLASEIKKPRGVTVIPTESVGPLLARTPVEALCGIGKKTTPALAGLGIRTCADLGNADEGRLHARFGIWGNALRRMGRGEDDSPVARLDEETAAKSVGHSVTFPADTSDPERLRAYLLWLSEKVGARLRRHGGRGREVVVTLRSSDFATRSIHRTLPHTVQNDMEIYAVARALLKEFMPLKKPVRLAGVAVARLSGTTGQLELFEDAGKPDRLSETLDRLNAKFGKGAVTRARAVVARKANEVKFPDPHEPSENTFWRP
jgi:DNA polymerase-4